MTMIIDIITQHAEEAAFLWLLRNGAVHEPHYSLKDLAHLDGRVEAHLDGLRIAGDAGWEICRDALLWKEPGEFFTAAVLAFKSGKEDRIRTVAEACGNDADLARGLISGLGWFSAEKALSLARPLIHAESSFLRYIGIAASAIHHKNPGYRLGQSLVSADPLLKARALKAAGELGRQDLLPLVEGNLRAKDQKCRYYAAWSMALLRSNESYAVLREIAESDSKYAEKACAMALCGMPLTTGHAWLRALSQKEHTLRLAVQSSGILGDPVAVPWLIQMMEIPEVARVAGEAFSMITGVNLAYADFEGEWPKGFEAGPTEEPGDENVAMDMDEDLSWPAPSLIARWWHENKTKFQAGTRYLVGRPITAEHLRQVLRTGYQRQRATAAIELVLLEPGQPLFEVRAPGFRQQRILNYFL